MDSESQAPVAIQAASIWLNRYLTILALSILYYDYLLTFGDEVAHFWGKAKMSLVSVLFVFNRYLGLLGPVPVITEFFMVLPPLRCRQLQMYHQYYAIICQLIVGMILIARTYALYSRSRRVLIGLLTFAILLLAATIAAVTAKTTVVTSSAAQPETSLGCDLSLTFAHAVGWIAMLCLDTTVFILTLAKTAQMREYMHHGLFSVLFRDARIRWIDLYARVLVVAGVANLLTFLITDANRGLATTLTNALSTTLISRICLNIRDPNLHANAHLGDQMRASSTSGIDATIASQHIQLGYLRTRPTRETADYAG
ncbi:hypothetical protein BD310DRAFT_915825 [Dichomitus squalens]|uniref:DUF6533 domain-containing protein n=1 Tax=Dichomitus squalens TaxID=114155 RepID=A0A4Q9Q963_9APHY|nr:hypothetical protein BD310DRAFT_915825 [Dichomitus squalens]